MKAPQIIMLSLLGISILIAANQHGKPRGNVNFWAALFGATIEMWILIAGGFFN